MAMTESVTPPSRVYRWVNFSGSAAALIFAVNILAGIAGIPNLLSLLPWVTKGYVDSQVSTISGRVDLVDTTLLEVREGLTRSTLSQLRRDEFSLTEKVTATPSDVQGRDFLADLRGEIQDYETELVTIHCQMAKRSGC